MSSQSLKEPTCQCPGLGFQPPARDSMDVCCFHRPILGAWLLRPQKASCAHVRPAVTGSPDLRADGPPSRARP